MRVTNRKKDKETESCVEVQNRETQLEASHKTNTHRCSNNKLLDSTMRSGSFRKEKQALEGLLCLLHYDRYTDTGCVQLRTAKTPPDEQLFTNTQTYSCSPERRQNQTSNTGTIGFLGTGRLKLAAIRHWNKTLDGAGIKLKLLLYR